MTTPSPASPDATAPAFAVSARTLTGALMGALVMFGVVLSFVLGTTPAPPVWVPLAQLLAGVALHVLVETIGYRVEPLDPGMADDEAAAVARVRWQSSMILRFALVESLAIASIVAAFVVDGGVWTYAGGALVSLVLMAVHAWPGSRSVTRTAGALEARGQDSFLHETFGLPAPGPIQQF